MRYFGHSRPAYLVSVCRCQQLSGRSSSVVESERLLAGAGKDERVALLETCRSRSHAQSCKAKVVHLASLAGSPHDLARSATPSTAPVEVRSRCERRMRSRIGGDSTSLSDMNKSTQRTARTRTEARSASGEQWRVWRGADARGGRLALFVVEAPLATTCAQRMLCCVRYGTAASSLLCS